MKSDEQLPNMLQVIGEAMIGGVVLGCVVGYATVHGGVVGVAGLGVAGGAALIVFAAVLRRRQKRTSNGGDLK